MMTTTQLHARTGATAIAAVLALSSTLAVGQTAQPATTDPAPAPATTEPVTTPAPAPEAAPVATEPAVTKQATRRTTTTRHIARAAPARPAPAPVATRTVTHKVTTHAAAPVAAVPVAAASVAAAPPATAATKAPPVVDLNAKPAAPAKPAAAPASSGFQLNQNELMLGAGALALIAVAAAAIAMRRRRRRLDDEAADYAYAEPVAETAPEPMPQHDPIFDQQPATATVAAAPAAGSAFAWGGAQPAAETSDDESDRMPGESWVERAYRGPSPANPSVSLKARLKRAAFFDKREREVEAGKAEPVDTDAGLPEAMDESELA